MTNFIKIENIELPKDDSRCAAILRTVIRNLKAQGEGQGMDSRAASIISAGGETETETNQVYALRQKMFGSYAPSTETRIGNQSRTASSIVAEPVSSRNKIFELRKVMFGSYS